MSVSSIFLCVGVIVATGCAISPPTFPDQFSSGIRQVADGKTRHGEWYWSEALNADRLDFVDEEAKFFEINDYTQGKRYSVIEKHRGAKSCESKDIPKEMPKFDFSDFTFVGERNVDGVKCDGWEKKTAAAVFVYADNVNSSDPALLGRRVNDTEEGYYFKEFRRGAQPATLFNISAVFNGRCNSTSESDARLEPVSLNSTIGVGCAALGCGDMQKIVRAHFPAAYQTDMICIAHYESSWCPSVYNGICCYGLWQINRNHLGEPGCPSSVNGLEQADPNASCARHVLDTQGLNAWTTWANGDCRHWTGCKA